MIDANNNKLVWPSIQNSIEKHKDAFDKNGHIWCELNNYFNDVNLEDIKFVDLNFDFESPNVFALFKNIWIFLINNTAKWIYDPGIDEDSIDAERILNIENNPTEKGIVETNLV